MINRQSFQRHTKPTHFKEEIISWQERPPPPLAEHQARG
jgi:hypothetical protein